MKNGYINRTAQETPKAANPERSHEDAEYLTTDEACEMARVSRWTIYRWRMMKDSNGKYLFLWGKLSSGKNSPVRINRASFKAFLETKMQNADKEGGESK